VHFLPHTFERAQNTDKFFSTDDAYRERNPGFVIFVVRVCPLGEGDQKRASHCRVRPSAFTVPAVIMSAAVHDAAPFLAEMASDADF
jgi:hypothetical protein